MPAQTLTLTQVKEALGQAGYRDIRSMSASAVGVVVAKTKVDGIVPHAMQIFRRFNPKQISDRELKIGRISVFAKNANVQRTARAFTQGRGNEFNLMQAINDYVADYGKPINIEFSEAGSPPKFTCQDVMKVVHVGAKNIFQRNKADLHFVTSKMLVYPVSIKDISASFWESADSYWGEKARAFLLWALDNKHTVLSENGDGGYSITPNIAIAATAQEIRDVVFGVDLLGKGAVIVQKFQAMNFQWDFARDVLRVQCKKVIREEGQVKGTHGVYFQIQNDRTRSTEFLHKGLRTKAATGEAVHHPGTKIFERAERQRVGI